MNIGEFIRVLQKLPQDCEIATLTATGHARPPVLVRVNEMAWRAGGSYSYGLSDPSNAFLVRPKSEII